MPLPSLNLVVQPFESSAGVIDCELRVDITLLGVPSLTQAIADSHPSGHEHHFVISKFNVPSARQGRG